MLDIYITSFGDLDFDKFCKQEVATVKFNSSRMVFASSLNDDSKFDLWCSFFEYDSALLCLPSKNKFKKGQSIPLVFDGCFFFEQGLVTYVAELGRWLPLEVFSIGSPILCAPSF